MQIMYFVAVEDLKLVDAGGVGLDPTSLSIGLFNPEVNIGLGSKHLYAKYLVANSPTDREQLSSVEKFFVTLRKAVQTYNGLKRPRTTSEAVLLEMDYNKKVWTNAKKYYPN